MCKEVGHVQQVLRLWPWVTKKAVVLSEVIKINEKYFLNTSDK